MNQDDGTQQRLNLTSFQPVQYVQIAEPHPLVPSTQTLPIRHEHHHIVHHESHDGTTIGELLFSDQIDQSTKSQ